MMNAEGGEVMSFDPRDAAKKHGKNERKIKGAARRARKVLSAHEKTRHTIPNARVATSRAAAPLLAFRRAAYASVRWSLTEYDQCANALKSNIARAGGHPQGGAGRPQRFSRDECLLTSVARSDFA